MSDESELNVNGVNVRVTNLKKVFYPRTGFTKGDVIDYYIRVSPFLLPHLHNRPITLKRYPDGVDGFFFYEKQCPSPHPKWVKTVKVSKSEGAIDYCIIGNLPALVWAANLADLELHTFLHRAPALERPTALVFDLDPGGPADMLHCCQVGRRLHRLFDDLGLQCFPKTSGSKGLQVYVPLNTAVTYGKTKAFARAIAERLEQESPQRVISKMQKDLRSAKEHPTVSTPVGWDEVETSVRKKSGKCLRFEAADIIQRLEKRGDLFAPVLSLKQKLPG
jgi:bifunctional non-homologous end joining protein LigD